jgi:6-phosphogluconolactonase/glucosamine-6-phosphate isomerase/deaminase
MVLGMGPDGHTAGIFPLPKESFRETYPDDLTYVPVHVEGLTINSRASFTPSWILGQVDELFAYVTGDSKHAMLESLVNETKELHERPAEILKRHRCAHLYTDQFLEHKSAKL